MKKLVLLFALTTVALGTVCIVQWRKVATQRQQITALGTETAQASNQLHELETVQERAEQQRAELLRQSDQVIAQLQSRQTNLAAAVAVAVTNAATAADGAQADKGAFGKMVAKMLQDPDTKKMIRAQQRVMMDQLYTPLIKQMGMTPEEGNQFKDILADNMMNAAGKASSLFDGVSGTNRAELLNTLDAEQKTFDDQLKTFLGDARFAQYKEFQETAGERTQFNLFKQQSWGDNPPNEQQTEQLLALMKEEKQKVAAETGQKFPGSGQDKASFEAMLSDEQVQKLLQSQEMVNQRVYERAKGLLPPEQIEGLGRFQTNSMQMMRMGMNMARKMFAPDKSAEAPAPGP